MIIAVLTTIRIIIIKSVITGQGPVTLEWKNEYPREHLIETIKSISVCL